jgi:hypothetical protein
MSFGLKYFDLSGVRLTSGTRFRIRKDPTI